MLFRLFLAACLSLAILFPAAAETPKIKVVATFSILGDIAREVGGDAIDLTVLVGPDGDAHTYQPTPEDAKKAAEAEIIAINGLRFEGWLTRLIRASGSQARLLVASAGVRPRIMEVEESHHHETPAHDHEGNAVDPHAWQDLRNGALYARNIAAAFIKARPELKEPIETRAAAYIEKIETLDKELKAAFAALPSAKRKIITGHDAFGYFGAAYSVAFIAPAGINTEAEPSAADIARLIRQIRQENVKTVFVENMVSPRLIEQLAKDSGATLGGVLYADALSPPAGPAPSYLAMMRHNADLILKAIE